MASVSEFRNRVVTQAELLEQRLMMEMILRLWDNLKTEVQDVDRRIAAGYRIEAGPESPDTVRNSATLVATDVLADKKPAVKLAS